MRGEEDRVDEVGGLCYVMELITTILELNA